MRQRGEKENKRGHPEGDSAEVGSKCLPRGYRVCQWGAGVAGRQGESSERCAVWAEPGQVPGTAGQGVVWGQGVGCGWGKEGKGGTA